jgi:hypothetical protein
MTAGNGYIHCETGLTAHACSGDLMFGLSLSLVRKITGFKKDIEDGVPASLRENAEIRAANSAGLDAL